MRLISVCLTEKRAAGVLLKIKMAEYFPHDYNARNDPKLIKLQMEMGQEGKGIFWDIVEMMYEQSGYLLKSQYATYSFSLKIEPEKIKRVLEDFDLFETDSVNIWSISILKRLQLRKDKSETARNSVNKRWLYGRNTKVYQTVYERNTKKESKVKEIKEKKERKETSIPNHLKDSMNAFVEMRTKIRKPVTGHAIELIIKDLQKWYPDNPDLQIQAIDNSVKSSWRGVFKIKDEVKNPNPQLTPLAYRILK